MLPQWIIEHKRDGLELSDDELRSFIQGYTDGSIPDYQMAALAMAVYFRGMSFREVTTLTDCMMHSGEVLDLSSLNMPTVDKHSTGGIGDKISLPLAPLVACCGVAVPMISGRGLGITGGTLDKLESIPGYRVDLSPQEFKTNLATTGCAIIGQTADLTPADRKLYALRDVTGTVPSIPLISASIMSKKLAEGADALVLDVKWGKGAFMKDLESARKLARTMVEIGHCMGRGMVAVLTDMNQPLGRTAGNALEVRETVEILRGEGPTDTTELTLVLGAHMLVLAGKADTHAAGIEQLREHIASGAGLGKFKEMVAAQGGDTGVIDDPDRLPAAPIREPWLAPRGGFVSEVDAELIGRACIALGAGRRRVEDEVDPAVGISDICKIGNEVDVDTPLARIHASDETRLDEARKLLERAFTLADERPEPPALVGESIVPEEKT